MDEGALRVLLARGESVEAIGRRFDRDSSTVSYWMRKYGLVSQNREKYRSKGGIDELRLTGLVEDGLSIGEIAAEVKMSKGTVRHWLRRYGLRTHGNSRAVQAAEAREAGEALIERECPTHGTTTFVLEGRGFYRCRRCRMERVSDHRRRIKAVLVAEAGGACIVCGYDNYLGALQFHHLDPAEKRLEINCSGAILSLETMRREAAKCVLLCGNCHAEVESGTRTLVVE